MSKITIKSPVRLISIFVGSFVCFMIATPIGWAFLIGALVGSFKAE